LKRHFQRSFFYVFGDFLILQSLIENFSQLLPQFSKKYAKTPFFPHGTEIAYRKVSKKDGAKYEKV